MPIKTALILAGGLGTRLRPVTYEIPKPLIPIRGITLTEHVIEKLKEAGVKKVYLSIGYMHEKIIKHFDSPDVRPGVEIEYLIEHEPLGTGGCLNMLSAEQKKKDFSGDFIVVNGDNLFDVDWAKMKKRHIDEEALITIALTQVDDVTSRGVVELAQNKILRFVEKPAAEDAPSNFISSGYYIFSPDVFSHLPKEKSFMLERSVFPHVATMGRLAGYADRGQWFDTGTFERWDEVIRRWRIDKR